MRSSILIPKYEEFIFADETGVAASGQEERHLPVGGQLARLHDREELFPGDAVCMRSARERLLHLGLDAVQMARRYGLAMRIIKSATPKLI